jgi:hypothetical protein
MKKALFILLCLMFAQADCFAGPFGFSKGMSLAQIQKLVGKIKKEEDGVYSTTKVPTPNASFQDFILYIHPSLGLVKILAISKDIETNGSGENFRNKFNEVAASLEKQYGRGEKLDYLKKGSLLGEPKDWMKSLLKKDRSLQVFWEGTKFPDNILAIVLRADAESENAGIISLCYEFEGFNTWEDRKKGKAT